MPKANPFKKGEGFGRLTALGECKSMDGGKSTYEKCLCKCGNITWQNRNLIRRGRIISCGCARNEAARQNLIKSNTKHSLSRTRIYNIYRGIKTRCYNKNDPKYKYYGGRGIKCLWKTFDEFYNDMVDSYNDHISEYGKNDTTIDRIDVNGNYCKENCRWATRYEQVINRRK